MYIYNRKSSRSFQDVIINKEIENKLPKLKNKNRKENEYTNQKFGKTIKNKTIKKKAYKLCLHVLDLVKPQLPVCFIKTFVF